MRKILALLIALFFSLGIVFMLSVPVQAAEVYKGGLPLLCMQESSFISEVQEQKLQVQSFGVVQVYDGKGSIAEVTKVVLSNSTEEQTYIVDEARNFCLVFSQDLKGSI